MMKIKLKRRKRGEEGFSLAELTVGMGVGAIILSMAIAFLVSFNTTSYRANAKSDITNTVRVGFTSVLKEVSSASTIPNCAQWKSEQAASQPPTDANKQANCLELVNGSEALRIARDNALCWNKAVDSSGSAILFPTKVACLYKGGSGVFCYDSTKTNKDTVYIAECNLSTPGTVIAGTSKIVADLGPHKDSAGDPGNFPVRSKLFTYINYDSSPFAVTTEKVLKVSVNAEISFKNGNFKNGSIDYGTYKYSSTIQIAGMRAFLEMGAYGS